MGVLTGNGQFCSVSTLVPHLTTSTIAESNIYEGGDTLAAILYYSCMNCGPQCVRVVRDGACT